MLTASCLQSFIISSWGRSSSAGHACCLRLTGDGSLLQVFFELIGQQTSSGAIIPAATARNFKRGRTDTFTYPLLPWVGHLQELRVGTDGAGCFPGWHLRWGIC